VSIARAVAVSSIVRNRRCSQPSGAPHETRDTRTLCIRLRRIEGDSRHLLWQAHTHPSMWRRVFCAAQERLSTCAVLHVPRSLQRSLYSAGPTAATVGAAVGTAAAGVAAGAAGAAAAVTRSAIRGKLKVPPASSITFTWQM